MISHLQTTGKKGTQIMMKKLLILLLTSLFTSSLFAENSIGINANDNSAEFDTTFNFNSFTGYEVGTDYAFDISSLSANGRSLFTVGYIGEGQPQGTNKVKVGFGIKATFSKSFYAIPLMVKIAYPLPINRKIPPTDISIAYTYAPYALTFSDDGKQFSEIRLLADMEVIDNVHIYGGYRTIDTDYITYSYNMDSSFFAGLKLSF